MNTDGSQEDTGLVRLLAFTDAFVQARAIQLAAELGIGDMLAGGPRDVDDLAAITSTHPDALFRLLRLLASCGVLTEVRSRYFGLAPDGEYLRTDHPQSVRSWFALCGVLISPVFAQASYSLRTGSPVFHQVFGEPFFDYMRNNPHHGALFDDAMADRSLIAGTAASNAYDFSAANRIVDVGGGNGALLSAILHAYPKVTGVLFDQPHVVDMARERIDGDGLTERCLPVGGDFFSDDLPEGDLYLMKTIIHDWPDAQAVSILRNCRRAMVPGSRLLLIEQILPVDDTAHPGKAMDFLMLLLFGGRERTRDSFAALLAEAGLRLNRVIDTALEVSIMEAVPDARRRLSAI